MADYTGEEFIEHMRCRDYRAIIRLRKEHEGELLIQPNPVEFRHLSIALLRSGYVADAIEHFQRLIEAIPKRFSSAFDYCELGAGRWIQGNVEQALKCWEQALQCKYGDGANNITPAFLLFYGAVRLRDDTLRERVTSLISDKMSDGWSKNWPASLGRLIVNTMTEEEVELELRKQHPLRQADGYCRFEFYRGLKLIESGNENEAAACFRSAVDVPNQQTNSTEFVLALNELREIPEVA
jgi:tetratricopeptide (TPR) repeat protein